MKIFYDKRTKIDKLCVFSILYNECKKVKKKTAVLAVSSLIGLFGYFLEAPQTSPQEPVKAPLA